MAEKPCGKCGEMVDEAKAFCPGCGNSFVEEKKRTSVSEFDQLDHTVQLGNTMYNQMLSDMGLSVSKAPNRDKPVDSIKPLAPAAEASETPKPTATKKRTVLLVVLILAVLAVLTIAGIAAIAIVFFVYSR